MKGLPRLSSEPTQYSDCCCTLSEPLMMTLARLLPPDPSITLSIGCGTGLLEAILLRYCPGLRLRAIEVKREVICYLSDEIFEIAKGTWDLCPSAAVAAAWIFIYPRETALVDGYRKKFGQGAVTLVIWIGPRADLSDYEEIFRGSWTKHIHEDCGLSQYETMISWERRLSRCIEG